MVIDFSELKKLVNSTVINDYDHALLLHEHDRAQAASGHELFGRTRFTPWQPTCENVLIDIVERLQKALEGEHHLVADVSDARAIFTIKGPKADQVLMKLCPVDMAGLAEGEIRRTRAAQVAAAFWKSGPEEFTLVSFRSVAGYVMGLLETSSRAGSEVF